MTTDSSDNSSALYTVRLARWAGRLFSGFLQWMKRNYIKVSIWVLTLSVLLWQFENWRGRRDLKQQRQLWIEEYGELKLQNFAPKPIPDDQNFFAAPIFESFTREPNNRSERAAKMRHAQFLDMYFPKLGSCEETMFTYEAAPGLKLLDVASWAENMRAEGKTAPEGVSDEAWIHQSMPPDPAIDGLVEALSRPHSMMLPFASDRWEIGLESGDPGAIPIRSTGNVTGFTRNLSLRARSAARVGDDRHSRDLCEILLRLSEGSASSGSLMGVLTAIATSKITFEALPECIIHANWSDEDLQLLDARLAAIEIERATFSAFYVEGFGIHMWPLDQIRTWYRDLELWTSPDSPFWSRAVLKLAQIGPDGWNDANLATHLRWWRMLIIPDTIGQDDLMDLAKKMDEGHVEIRKELATLVTPRRAKAQTVFPLLGNIVIQAARVQTRKRQLRYAIAIERYALRFGKFPSSPDELVPDFIEAIPDDPWTPGRKLGYELESEREQYRLTSSNEEMSLVIPKKIDTRSE